MKLKPLSIPVLFLCLQSASWNSYGNKGETVMFAAELVSHPDAVNSPGQASSRNNKTEIGLHLALFGENIKWLFWLLFWSLFLGMLPTGFSIYIAFLLPFRLQVDVFLCLWMWVQSLKQVVQRAILCEMKKPLLLPPKVCLQEGFRCCFASRNIRRTRPRPTGLDGGMHFVGHKDATSDANNALLQASIQGHTDAVRELLQQGAEVNMQDGDGFSALQKASEKGHTDIVRELLLHGAEVNTQNEYGYTALHGASAEGHTDIVRELLLHGAEVNTQDKDGYTALHQATQNGHTDTVRELLLHGAEVNTQDKYGHTALHVAINRNYPSIVEFLLSHGAYADISIFSLAKERALSKVASLVAKQLGLETEAVFLEKGCFYPVFVCTREAFLTLPNLIKYEEACKLMGCIVMIPVKAVVVFFSHHWLNGSRSREEGGAHPDRDDAYKCRAMQHVLQNDFPNATHVWVDFLCVPQEDPDSQLLAINSLPYIVRQCAHFVVLHGISGMLNEKGEDEASFQVYNSRGWRRLECLSALAPLEEGEQEIIKWRLDLDAQTVEYQPSVFEKDLSIFNPLGDGSVFYDDRDRKKIALMVFNLAKRFVENDFGIAKSAVKFFPEDLKKKYEKVFEGSI